MICNIFESSIENIKNLLINKLKDNYDKSIFMQILVNMFNYYNQNYNSIVSIIIKFTLHYKYHILALSLINLYNIVFICSIFIIFFLLLLMHYLLYVDTYYYKHYPVLCNIIVIISILLVIFIT